MAARNAEPKWTRFPGPSELGDRSRRPAQLPGYVTLRPGPIRLHDLAAVTRDEPGPPR